MTSRLRSSTPRILILTLAAAAFAGCGKPPPPQTPDGALVEPMPSPPDWVSPYLNKLLPEVFPKAQECTGYVDRVDKRYAGDSPGVEIIGWGWSYTDSATYRRVIAVNSDNQIVGGGEGGVSRGDVQAAIPAVKDVNSGFWARTAQTSGPIRIFGISATNDAVCQLGAPLTY